MLDINCKLIERWDVSAGVGPVDVSTDLQKLAMDTVGARRIRFALRLFRLPRPGSDPAELHNRPGGVGICTPTPVFKEELATLHAFIDGLIAEHRSGEREFEDLLALMLQQDPSGKPVLETQNIRNQIMTFLIAGQLTTSELMPNALYNIVSDPTVLHRVQAEVDTVFGTEDDYLPGYDDIGKLTYLRQVIEETLRLSPPVLNFDRMALEDTVIGGKYPIKRGEAVTVLTGALHRQPRVGRQCRTLRPRPLRSRTLGGPAGRVVQTFRNRRTIVHRAAVRAARGDHGTGPARPSLPPHRRLPLCAAVGNPDQPPAGRIPARYAPAHSAGPPYRSALASRAPLPDETRSPATAITAGTRLAILYGSNLGTCRALARQFADDATALGCTATVAPLDDAVGGFPEAEAVVIIASSYNGQPTDDARAFLAWLLDADTTLNPAPNVAVLGVGDHNWADTYQVIPQRIDERLGELEANRLVPRAAADTSGDLVGTVEEFAGALVVVVGRALR